jgi:hypothetical protein
MARSLQKKAKAQKKKNNVVYLFKNQPPKINDEPTFEDSCKNVGVKVEFVETLTNSTYEYVPNYFSKKLATYDAETNVFKIHSMWLYEQLQQFEACDDAEIAQCIYMSSRIALIDSDAPAFDQLDFDTALLFLTSLNMKFDLGKNEKHKIENRLTSPFKSWQDQVVNISNIFENDEKLFENDPELLKTIVTERMESYKSWLKQHGFNF